ncbi:hypothetical protein [Ruminococcus sp.]|uniref:hypothetical protein n=1 Tax=Ruminococcus sp. TaxID=41978 RepID=UPI0025ED7E43|nr:hypothetical protein [Ruminococcus sp.]
MKAIKKHECRKCLYYIGRIKFPVSPCMQCRVYGGVNKPITGESIIIKNEASNGISKERGVKR